MSWGLWLLVYGVGGLSALALAMHVIARALRARDRRLAEEQRALEPPTKAKIRYNPGMGAAYDQDQAIRKSREARRRSPTGRQWTTGDSEETKITPFRKTS